jgi:hypothetical protein
MDAALTGFRDPPGSPGGPSRLRTTGERRPGPAEKIRRKVSQMGGLPGDEAPDGSGSYRAAMNPLYAPYAGFGEPFARRIPQE